MLRASRSPLTNGYIATNKSQLGSEITRIEVSKDVTLVMHEDLSDRAEILFTQFCYTLFKKSVTFE